MTHRKQSKLFVSFDCKKGCIFAVRLSATDYLPLIRMWSCRPRQTFWSFLIYQLPCATNFSRRVLQFWVCKVDLDKKTANCCSKKGSKKNGETALVTSVFFTPTTVFDRFKKKKLNTQRCLNIFLCKLCKKLALAHTRATKSLSFAFRSGFTLFAWDLFHVILFSVSAVRFDGRNFGE